MKKVKITVSMLLTLICSTAEAQTWGPGGTNTYTPYNVGIGATSVPLDALLHIYGQPTYTSCPGGGTKLDYPNPEAWIDRQTCYSCYPGFGCSPSLSANFFQVNTTGMPGSFSPGTTILDVINGSGWLGVLNSSPATPLDVNGNATVRGNLQMGGSLSMDITGDGVKGIFGNSHSYWLGLCSGHGGGIGADGAYIQMNANGFPSDPGSIYITATAGTTNSTQFIYQPPSGPPQTHMAVRNDGAIIMGNVPTPNVGGPANPGGYALYVQYGILTEKVKVAMSGDPNWSDFVFNKDYKLRALSDIESYIKANNHLPEIPSASEVAKDGIDVAGMDAKLLQKIEELTLYVIQQQKEINKLKAQINK